MATTVRTPGPEERQRIGALLTAIQSHTDACPKCAAAVDGHNLCAVGADLYERWADYLEARGEGGHG